jgi:enoyl-CoA hydratase/carnithine racemase
VLTVTFNNPPRHFFDERMSIELDDLTRALRRDDSVGAVVFTGTDSTYITHFDVGELLRASRRLPCGLPRRPASALTTISRFACRNRMLDRALRHTPAREPALMARTYAALRRLNESDKVIVTAINGLALGMGCIFALACDIRLMARDQQIGLPESAIAMLAAAGGTARLVRMLGESRAVELLLEGRWLAADEAAELGLVHRVVAPEDLRAEADTVAQRLARRSPVINREIKRMVYDAGSRTFGAATRMEAASLLVTVGSTQARRSMQAYHRSLLGHEHLTDAAVRSSWQPLLRHGVPGGAGRNADKE